MLRAGVRPGFGAGDDVAATPLARRLTSADRQRRPRRLEGEGRRQLGAGDLAAFVVICALSGVALGADLTLPSALLAGIIGDAGDRGRHEGAYFGWWNFCTKLNLALAAGLALPMLGWFGYAPGARDPQALQALVVAYCVLPCVLKLIASGALYALFIKGSKP